jgi:hypothetical protein
MKAVPSLILSVCFKGTKWNCGTKGSNKANKLVSDYIAFFHSNAAPDREVQTLLLGAKRLLMFPSDVSESRLFSAVESDL